MHQDCLQVYGWSRAIYQLATLQPKLSWLWVMWWHNCVHHNGPLLHPTTSYIYHFCCQRHIALSGITKGGQVKMTHSVCLVELLDAPLGPLPQCIIDNNCELGLSHVCAHQNLRLKEFIFAWSIIHGTPLIRDFDRVGYFYVMDVVDHTGDLFLHCNKTFRVWSISFSLL